MRQFEKDTGIKQPAADSSEEPRLHEDAEQFGIEPAHSEDVVLGAEIGGVGGAVAGALAGSALGIPGAITGAVIGGVIGAAGSAAAVAVVDKIDDDSPPEEVDQLMHAPERSEEVQSIPPLPPPDAYRGTSESASKEERLIPEKFRPEHPAEPPAEIDPNLRARDGVPYPDPIQDEGMANHKKHK